MTIFPEIVASNLRPNKMPEKPIFELRSYIGNEDISLKFNNVF